MSDRIGRQWHALRTQGRAGLVPYLTAGYPSAETTVAALRMVAEAGADLVEVGIPFSDPLADGPVIQRSTYAALESGMTVQRALRLIHEAALEIPVVAFGYLNPILAYGVPRFLDDAAAAGVDGLLITDLPAGEDPDFEHAVRGSRLDLIRLVAPTTDPARMRLTVRDAQGFVYLISRLGVTGPATSLDATVARTIGEVRSLTDLPVALGFGIGTAAQAVAAAQLADGVVVGSALIRALAQGLDAARELVVELRSAVGSVDRTAAAAASASA